MARPSFADKYPKNAELDALVERFEAGDYAAVRDGAKKLLGRDPEVAAAVRDLVSRTEPDPIMKWLLLAVLVMILAVSAYWMLRARR